MTHANQKIFKIIAAWVAMLHAVLLISLFWIGAMESPATKPKQLLIQTIQLKPQTVTPPQTSKTPVPSPSTPSTKKPTVKSTVKSSPKSTKKSISKPIAKPTAKTPPATPSKNIPSKATLDALKSKLAAIPTTTTIAPISYQANASSLYENELATKLRILLKLPEVGTVKVALTLNRQGKVIKTEIVASENEANKRLVEMRLPTIQFPPFGSAFAGENTYTFNLTLTNI